MSWGSRLAELFGRGGRERDDATAVLDASYEQQAALLVQSRRGVADVVTSRKRVELQVRGLQQQVEQLSAQAREAVAAGSDDAARVLLQRRAALLDSVSLLEPDAARLREQEDRLQAQVQRLEVKVEAFRTQRATIKAQRSAAEAQVRVVEATAGLSQEGADVELALQQARDETDALQARADAAQELSRDDAIALPGETAGESAQRRLAALERGDVEADLAQLRAEVQDG